MDIDHFFYWGQNDIAQEITDDVQLVLIQPKGSLFYARSYGAGIKEHENGAAQLSTQVALRYDAVMALTRRNAVVSDGSRGYPDRRAVASQGTVEIEPKDGGMDVTIGFIMLGNYQTPQRLVIATGGR